MVLSKKVMIPPLFHRLPQEAPTSHHMLLKFQWFPRVLEIAEQ